MDLTWIVSILKVTSFDLQCFRCLQGDMFQTERNDIISSFKKQEFPVLVATDVAARGLDIPHIRNVVNFDVARDIDTHTHRVGRTGRAGLSGNIEELCENSNSEKQPLFIILKEPPFLASFLV